MLCQKTVGAQAIYDSRYLGVSLAGLGYGVSIVGEREGGKKVLKRVKQSSKQVSRLTTIWVDGGNDCEPQSAVGDGLLSLDCAGGSATRTNQGLCLAQKTLGRGAHFRLVDGVPAIG